MPNSFGSSLNYSLSISTAGAAPNDSHLYPDLPDSHENVVKKGAA